MQLLLKMKVTHPQFVKPTRLQSLAQVLRRDKDHNQALFVHTNDITLLHFQVPWGQVEALGKVRC